MSCCCVEGPAGSICTRAVGHPGSHAHDGIVWEDAEPTLDALTKAAVEAGKDARRRESLEAESLADILAAAAASKLTISRLRVGDIEIDFAAPEPPPVKPSALPQREHPTIEMLKEIFPNGLPIYRPPGG